MMSSEKSLNKLIDDLKERAKELNCFYEVQELLNDYTKSTNEIFQGIIKAIPPGWQYPDVCAVKIVYSGSVFQSKNFKESNWVLNSNIVIQNEVVGTISVYYLVKRPEIDEGPFLKEERKLINTIAEQIGSYIFHMQLKSVFEEKGQQKREKKPEWWIIVEMLKGTDPKLLIRISRKMVNYLCWSGINEAGHLFEHFSPAYKEANGLIMDENRPYQQPSGKDLLTISYDIFKVAGKYLSNKEIQSSIQKWIKQDRSSFLVNIMEDTGSSLVEISNAIERIYHLIPQGLELSASREKNFRVALIRRILSDQHNFINIAKQFIEIDDFNYLIKRIIYPVGSHGKLGGKSSGLFLSEKILKKTTLKDELLHHIKTPKTWYLTSDGILNFMKYNNLEDIIEQKYKDIDQVRNEYPYVLHVFKNSSFTPEIIKSLSLALDDFGKVPLIVRSSSLLEDRLSTVFAGKYKSLFIANHGTKEKRLTELMDAITEVYASTFGPDPIEYRSEHGLLDYHEEMGIMIQEVVGKRVGDYYLPAFAGVAFSQNDFRWSSRITSEDGLIRMVPGLGTRAVDRLSDDYPILIAPGQPYLRVNVTIDEIIKYSPNKLDVINLKTNVFETIDIQEFIKEVGTDYPIINNIVSIIDGDYIKPPRKIGTDFQKENFIVTFEGLIHQTDFIKQTQSILNVLKNEFGYPIDIEFAHDGENFYLLQCRSQSYSATSKPAVFPDNIADEQIIFSANKYISNGTVNDISHIVYVNPQEYSELSNYEDLKSVGRAIGRLNRILPKRQFILMGPGRWGSRGDIKLGVSVTYSEINNTAMLIEIARKKKDYVPELSFGTHFFQDLVESNILYLPLYPDDSGILFKESFLLNSKNILTDLFPDMDKLSSVIKVIDVSQNTNGELLHILMNAEEGKALAILSEQEGLQSQEDIKRTIFEDQKRHDIHWRWRLRSVENIAANLDPKRFGVKGFYIFGSTKNATAGPSSDIDILIHFDGSNNQRKDLTSWLEGWSLSLAQMNYLRTGYKSKDLLDVHIITDEDIEKRTSYAVKIGAITDAAKPLPVGSEIE